jgi:hypothetical protein
MALANRPKATPPKGGGTRSRSSTDTAIGKAEQRARNKAAGSVTGSGSSGKAKGIAKFPKRTWEELVGEDQADLIEHVTDIAGKISHSQIGGNGYLVSTLNSPMEYAHDLLDAHMKCQDGMVYIRVYHVPFSAYLGKLHDGKGGMIDGEE